MTGSWSQTYLLLSVLLYYSIKICCANQRIIKEGYEVRVNRTIIVSESFISIRSVVECGSLCLQHHQESCYSYSYNRKEKICNISSSPTLPAEFESTESETTIFQTTDDCKLSQENCSFHGECIDGDHSHSCLCHGYQGPICETVEPCTEVGWTRSPVTNKCMWLTTVLRTRNAQQENCESRSSTLAVLNSSLAYDWVVYLRDYEHDWQENRNFGFHVGASKQNGEWTWDDGTPVDTALFIPGEPSDDGDCAFMSTLNHQYKLNDNPCSKSNYAICERQN